MTLYFQPKVCLITLVHTSVVEDMNPQLFGQPVRHLHTDMIYFVHRGLVTKS